jgi:hypothetical protein
VEEAFDACEEFMQVAALPILGVGLLGHAVDGDAQVGQAGKDKLIDFFFGEEEAIGAKGGKELVAGGQLDEVADLRMQEGFTLEVEEHAPEVGVELIEELFEEGGV